MTLPCWHAGFYTFFSREIAQCLASGALLRMQFRAGATSAPCDGSLESFASGARGLLQNPLRVGATCVPKRWRFQALCLNLPSLRFGVATCSCGHTHRSPALFSASCLSQNIPTDFVPTVHFFKTACQTSGDPRSDRAPAPLYSGGGRL